MLTAALRKELLLQWRTRAQFMAVFVFGAAALLLFSFAVGPVAELLRQFSAGFLWLGLLLSSTLTLAESFHAEMENRALEGLLLLPANPRALYYGKAIANWLQLALLGIALDSGDGRSLRRRHDAHPVLILVIVLGTAGLSAPGTLYAAMTAQVRSKQTLLPLLLFPLIVPALLASVKATSLIILGDPMDQVRSWIILLAAFDAIYWSLCGLLFGSRRRVIGPDNTCTSTTIAFRGCHGSSSASASSSWPSARTSASSSRRPSSSWARCSGSCTCTCRRRGTRCWR